MGKEIDEKWEICARRLTSNGRSNSGGTIAKSRRSQVKWIALRITCTKTLEMAQYWKRVPHLIDLILALAFYKSWGLQVKQMVETKDKTLDKLLVLILAHLGFDIAEKLGVKLVETKYKPVNK